MHSVVVMGDVRTHLVDLERDAEWEHDKTPAVRIPPRSESFGFYGGAMFMKDAIEAVLKRDKRLRVDSTDTDGVGVFGYRTRRAPDNPSYNSTGNVLKWFLKPFTIEEDQKPRPRLKFRVSTPSLIPAQPDDALIKCLTSPSREDRRFEVSHTPPLPDTRESPDIVVLDDLNEGMRNVRFEIPTNRSVGAIEKRLASKANLSTRLDELQQRERDLYSLLFYRMTITRDKSKEDKIPLLEPVIIGSIKNRPDEILKDRRDGTRKDRTVWEHLFDDDWFRERTCLLLDAEDLRDCGCAISSGLSWERTAQDTISEFWKRERLRPLLQFSQVVVRYGVTGALHIVRRSEAVWTYMLFFDPAHDDMAWSVEDRDGVVLGVTSVYAATIVQALDRHCISLKEHPFLGRYATTIADCLPTAITRSRYLNDVAYGEEGWSTFREKFAPELPIPNWLPPSVFSDPYSSVKPRFKVKPNGISTSSVPPMVLSGWSIVGQSAQGRYGELAREIVMYGPDKVLNQPVVDRRYLVNELTDVLIRSLSDEIEAQKSPRPPSSELIRLLNWPRIYDRAFHHMQQQESIFGRRSAHNISRVVKGREANWDPVGETIISWVDRNPASKMSPANMKQIAQQLIANPTVYDDVISLPQPSDVVAEPLVAPLVAFPAATDPNSEKWPLFIVDRREIEGYRAIRKLMRQHIASVQSLKDSGQSRKTGRPLCIAVFGPPGAGKSMAVKKINESLPNTNTKVLDPFNVAQFEGLDDLEDAFDKILNASKGMTVPIAFFDEFDTNFGESSETLGWLKYFLAPMEDGEFRGKSVRNAILVFAGGTSRTFSEFSLAHRGRTDDQWVAFSKAKGPDFTSRLLGHLDIVGINPAGSDDELYMVRRAILIRALLTQIQGLHSGDSAKISEDMLHAFLHVPEFRHGGRSVRMLLELCRSTGVWISASAVPPIHQLDMLVDGKSFMDLLSRFNPRFDSDNT